MNSMDAQQFHTFLELIYTSEGNPTPCEVFNRQLPAYVEGEMAGRPSQSLRQQMLCHLAGCPQCWDVYLGIHEALREG